MICSLIYKQITLIYKQKPLHDVAELPALSSRYVAAALLTIKTLSTLFFHPYVMSVHLVIYDEVNEVQNFVVALDCGEDVDNDTCFLNSFRNAANYRSIDVHIITGWSPIIIQISAWLPSFWAFCQESQFGYGIWNSERNTDWNRCCHVTISE